MVVEEMCLLVVLIGRLGRHGAFFVATFVKHQGAGRLGGDRAAQLHGGGPRRKQGHLKASLMGRQLWLKGPN